MNQQVKHDVLLECLSEISAHFGQPFNREAILANLPLTHQGLTPELLLKAARRAGFEAEFEKQHFDSIERYQQVVIVLLKNNDAAIYIPAVNSSEAHFLVADQHGNFNKTTLQKLQKQMIGFQILLRPETSVSVSGTQQSTGATQNPARQHWFWGTMWEYRSLYLQLLPASLMVNLFALVMPFFVMIIYDRVVPNNAVETLWVLAAGVGLVFLFDLAIRLVRGSLIERAGNEMDIELAGKLYEHVMALSMRAVPASVGNLASRIRSYETLREFFVSATMLAIADMPFALLMIGAIFYLAGPIGWVLVFACTIAVAVSVWIQFPLYKAVRSSAEVGLERQAFIGESIANLEPIKINNAEGYFQRRMNRLLKNASANGAKSHWYGLLANSLTTTIINITSVVIVVAGVYQVSAGNLSMGGLIACVMLGSRCLAPMAILSGLMTRFQQALQSLESLDGVMALEREASHHKQYLQHNEFKPRFTFNDVTVQYSEKTRPALKGISLQIEEGEKIALLGRIGSGKSTLLKVMAGLQPVSSGSIMVDDFELSQYHPATLRNRIGYVPQEAALFHGTVRDNVALGNTQLSDADILNALEISGLGDYIKSHPLGLLGEVGERGSLLSGGQRRALTLARCLIQSNPLLLLDEPTANLDPQTEKSFVNTLKAHTDGRTLVVATHKASVLELVDRAIILDQGKVISDGPVSQVLAHLQRSQSNEATKHSTRAKATASVKRRPSVESTEGNAA